jgi:hypothetical protein
VEPDVVFEDDPLAVDGDAIAPRADAGIDDDGLDAFDFPLSVEW